MARTRRVIRGQSAPACVIDFIDIELSESHVQILYQMHDNNIPFQWEYIHRNYATLLLSYIKIYISKLCLDFFKDHAGGKNLTVIK